MSISYWHCTHKKIRHSPDGVDVIEECPVCCMAWLIEAITGDITRLEGSSYEHRLIEQRLRNTQALDTVGA